MNKRTRVAAGAHCGALGLTVDCWPDWGTAALPVPDLIEEMVSRALEDGGRVLDVHDGPGGMLPECPVHRAGDKGPHNRDVRR